MSRGTLDPAACNQISRTGLSPSLAGFPFAYMALTFFGVLSHTLQLDSAILVLVRNPNGISTAGLASSAFARHY